MRLFAWISQLLTADSHIRRMPLDLAIQRERVRNPGFARLSLEHGAAETDDRVGRRL